MPLIAATIAWSLVAFGGAYAWTLLPAYVLVAAAAVAVRPRVAAPRERLLDFSLCAVVGAAACQLVPLSPSLRSALSPHAVALDEGLRVGGSAGWAPLSIDPTAGMTWLPAGAAAVVLFWVARSALTATTVRSTARTIAWIGLIVGPLVVVQHYSSPYLLYWTFRPIEAGSATAGPFVNRNHMATWLLLALPITVGYLIAHAQAHMEPSRGLSGAVRIFEQPRTFWLIAAAAAMLTALITTQSRSGIIGLLAAIATAMLLPRASGRRVHRGAATLIIGAAAALAIALTSTGVLLSRFETVGTDPVGGRLAIWKQTAPMVQDFALTGVGFGSYATAMLAYQHQARYHFFYNQAHDQYLQFLAEGGLLAAIPILLVIVAFSTAAARALANDRSALFWIRAGAGAALVGVAVQSIWETGLRMPANALLCAVVAAAVVYRNRG